MKNLTVIEIEERWNKLLEIINSSFEGKRKEKILKMYNFFETRMALAPASGRLVYHGAYAGGYLDHILSIYQVSKFVYKMYSHLNGIIDFTMEELVFSVLHHDLGKIGDLDYDYYIPNDNDWAIKNKKEIFVHNPKLQYMKVPHRAIWLLQHFEITITQKEYLAIMLSDGVFDDGIKPYFTQYSEDKHLKTNLPYLVHWSDWISTNIEKDQYKKTQMVENKSVSNLKNKKTEKDILVSKSLSNKFIGENEIQSSKTVRDTVYNFQQSLEKVFDGEE